MKPIESTFSFPVLLHLENLFCFIWKYGRGVLRIIRTQFWYASKTAPCAVMFFWVAVVRIMLPTPSTRQAQYGWGFLPSETARRLYTYNLFHARVRRDMQFRKGSPYAVIFWCRYAAPVANPLTWDNTLYILGLPGV